VIPDALRAAARRFGTPVYVTSVAALHAAEAELRDAFPDPWLRAYSVKANDVPAIIRRLGERGLDVNVVSSGEWAAARKAGIGNARITLEGIGKTPADLRAAIRAAADGDPLRWVAVESPEELEALTALARRAGLGGRGGPPVEVLLRLNPDVTPETHAGLAVGRGTSKFGMTETELTTTVAAIRGGGPVALRGIHLHVGSQLGAVDAWRDAVRRGLAVLALVGAGRDGFDTFDVGGGFPVGDPGTVPTPGHFARELPPLFDALPPDRRPARLAVEPGRFLVAGAGRLVARVLHVRERVEADRVVVLDAGMAELVRPALYGAIHPVTALTSLGRPLDGAGRDGAGDPVPATSARVDGPICESTDTLDRHDLPPLRRGDLVAIGEAGAYAASMAMAYNGRPVPAQALLEPDGSLTLGRRRRSLPYH
jgi:diaminopimelate decarboxylase